MLTQVPTPVGFHVNEWPVRAKGCHCKPTLTSAILVIVFMWFQDDLLPTLDLLLAIRLSQTLDFFLKEALGASADKQDRTMACPCCEMVMQVSMAATTREFLIMARHNLIPSWLAVVHPSLGTPYRVITAYGILKCELPCPSALSSVL